MDFVAEQANAWSHIVQMMLGNPWNVAANGASVNGPGSSLEYTRELRVELPKLLRKYNVTTMLDAPCGDWTWMSRVDISYLHSYVGMDVQPDIIQANQRVHGFRPNVAFIKANLLTKNLFPKVDLILCRDFLAHLPNDYISSMIQKFKRSGSKYLLASNYPGSSNEFNYVPTDYTWLGYLERPHDLTLDPFNLKQVDSITETPAVSGVISRDHELGLFEL